MNEVVKRKTKTIYERAGEAAIKALSNGHVTFCAADARKATRASSTNFWGSNAWRKVQAVLERAGILTVQVTEYCIENYYDRPCSDLAEAHKCSPFQGGHSPALGVRRYFDGDLVATTAQAKFHRAATQHIVKGIATVKSQHDEGHLTKKPLAIFAQSAAENTRLIGSGIRALGAGDPKLLK